MDEIIEGKGIERTHIKTRLMAESLIDKSLLESTYVPRVRSLLPKANFLMIGGRVIDLGKSALIPLIEEIVENKNRHEMIIGAGGGLREKHTYEIGLDLGLPTGGLATLAGAISEQNTLIIQTLLSEHGAIRIPKDHYMEFPLYLKSGIIPVITSMPPYHYWEPPPKHGKLPDNTTDIGLYLLAEVFGAKSMIFIKDEDGLYTEDPKKNSNSKFISKISAKELIEMNLPDMIIDRSLLEVMLHARHTKKIRIINGLKPGNLTKALDDQDVGTVIYQD